MNREEAKARLRDVFRNVFDGDSIALRPQTTASDIAGWDSLARIRIVISREQEPGVRLKPREINALENAGEMINHLMGALRSAGRA